MKTQHTSPEDKAVIKYDPNQIPGEIPVLPLDSQVAFPKLNMSLAVPVAASSLIETAMKGNKLVGVIGSKRQAVDNPQPGEMYETGTVVRVLYVTRAPDNTVLMVAHGLKRFRIAEWIPGKDFLSAKIRLAPEILEGDIETEALHRNLRDLTKEIFNSELDFAHQNHLKLCLDSIVEVSDRAEDAGDQLELATLKSMV